VLQDSKSRAIIRIQRVGDHSTVAGARSKALRPVAGSRSPIDESATDENAHASDRLQEFDQIGLLSRGEIQLELIVVVIDHRQEIRRTPIMKIGRMLPECP
jgi:hypothetical protein